MYLFASILTFNRKMWLNKPHKPLIQEFISCADFTKKDYVSRKLQKSKRCRNFL